MTFVPTPKAELEPLSDLYGGWNAFSQQILSRLWHAEQAADWAAEQIANLYAQNGFSSSWLWAGTPQDADPGSGRMSVVITGGNNRLLTISKTDANAMAVNLLLLTQGGTVVLTDDPDAPPITAFRQYLVTANPVDHGSWVQVAALRLATFGSQDVPLVDSRVRLLLR